MFTLNRTPFVPTQRPYRITLRFDHTQQRCLRNDFCKGAKRTAPRRSLKWTVTYRKIPKISPGAYIFQRPFFEGLIFGGAYIRRGLSVEGNLRLEIDWASLIVLSKFIPFLLCFTLYLRAIFQAQAPRGLIFGGAI